MSALRHNFFPPPNAIEDAAADWVARRNGGLSPGETVELQQWLSADPSHAMAFTRADAAWATITRPRRVGLTAAALQGLEVRRRRRTHRRRIAAGVTGVALAAVLVFALGPWPSKDAGPEFPASIALRPDVQTLPDGSTAELNAGADVVVNFSPEQRRVRVDRGEVLFSVRNDTSRPFVVVAGGVEVRAVGTAFSVRFEPEKVGVVVTEGQVAITPPPGDGEVAGPPKARPVLLGAGARLELSAEIPAPVTPAIQPLTAGELSAALAWRGRRLEFSGTRLPEALACFNRHNRVQLVLADPALANRRISGIFWIDDPLAFVRLLETGLSLKADRAGESIVLRGD